MTANLLDGLRDDWCDYLITFFLRGDKQPLCTALREEREPLPERLRHFVASVLEGDVRVYRKSNPKRPLWTPLVARLERERMKRETKRYCSIASAFGKTLDPVEAYEIYRYDKPHLPKTRKKAEELFATTVTGAAVKRKLKSKHLAP